MDNLQNRALVERSEELDLAYLGQNKNERPQTIQKMTFDLSVARPRESAVKALYPFRSLSVESATDPATNIFILPNTDDDQQSFFVAKQNDSWTVERKVSKALLFWDAQPGKKITINFFADSEFRSGSQLSVSSGGVSITEGTSASGPLSVTLLAATAAIIAPVNLSRKVATIENKTGGDIFIAGDNTVTASGVTEGLRVPPGAKIIWKNSGALYGFSVFGGSVARVEEL